MIPLRKNGIIAISRDELINVRLVEQDEEIVMGTRVIYAILQFWRSQTDQPNIDRCRGIDLREDDVVVGMDIC